jgi:hypothetical protein
MRSKILSRHTHRAITIFLRNLELVAIIDGLGIDILGFGRKNVKYCQKSESLNIKYGIIKNFQST